MEVLIPYHIIIKEVQHFLLYPALRLYSVGGPWGENEYCNDHGCHLPEVSEGRGIYIPLKKFYAITVPWQASFSGTYWNVAAWHCMILPGLEWKGTVHSCTPWRTMQVCGYRGELYNVETDESLDFKYSYLHIEEREAWSSEMTQPAPCGS